MQTYKSVLLILVLAMGCRYNQPKQCTDRQIIISKFPTGNLHEICIINCVDTTFATFFSFKENGDTDLIMPFLKGKISGVVKIFGEHNKMCRMKFYSEDRVDSVWQSFDKNGTKRSVQYYIEYPWQLSNIDYDSAGHIEDYVYIDDKKPVLKILYDTNGVIDTVVGSYLTDVQIIKSDTNLKSGDSVKYYFFIANPPYDSIRFAAGVCKASEQDGVGISEIPIINSKATLSALIHSSGNYEVRYYLNVFHKNKINQPHRYYGRKHIIIK